MKKVSLFLSLLLITLSNSSFAQNGDCSTPLILCNKNTLEIETLNGHGEMADNLGDLKCPQGVLKERNSMWIKWEVKQSGNLGFAIIPNGENDDYDFAVYKVGGTDECANLTSIRCMASGQNLGGEENIKCKGATGLTKKAADLNESIGCYGEDDNFLAPLEVFKGEQYLLYLNNYSSTDGFKLEFSGGATFSDKACEITSPTNLFVSKIFPNPTSDVINITIDAPKDDKMNISILDGLGKRYSTTSQNLKSGNQQISLRVTDLASGTYVVQLKIGEELIQRKFTKVQ